MKKEVVVESYGGILDGPHYSRLDDRGAVATAIYTTARDLRIGEEFYFAPLNFECKYPHYRTMTLDGQPFGLTITTAYSANHVYRLTEREEDDDLALLQIHFCGFDGWTTAYAVTESPLR